MRRRSKDPFGQMAVNMGFCTPRDVKEALASQSQILADDHSHKMVGMILLERGVISTTQLIQVLQYCDRAVHSDDAAGQPHSTSKGESPVLTGGTSPDTL